MRYPSGCLQDLANEPGQHRDMVLRIQYWHAETDWTCGIPEILPPDKGDQLGFVNITGRLVCKPR